MYSAERKFVKTATANMRILETIWSQEQSSVDGLQSSHAAFQQIKLSAQTVQARAIFRACVLSEDSLPASNAPVTAAHINSLTTLDRLIGQYASGLYEIDPAFESIMNGKGGPVASPVIAINDHGKANRRAKNTLTELMPLVRNADTQNALDILMKHAPASNDRAQRLKKSVSLDTLMNGVTNLALSEARHTGKQISLSYGADFDTVPGAMASGLQEFLEMVCLGLVSRGIQGGGKISLSGTAQTGALSFAIDWDGVALTPLISQQSHLKRAIDALRQNGGSFSHGDKQTAQQKISLSFPLSTAKPLPLSA